MQSQDQAQIFLAKLVDLSLYNSTNPSLLADICCNEKSFGWEMSNSLYPVTGPLSQFLRAKATFESYRISAETKGYKSKFHQNLPEIPVQRSWELT